VADEDLKLDRAFLKYEQDNSGVDAKFSDGHWERCAALIGAGGFHSAVREQLIQQADPPRYSGYTCWRGITTFSSPLVRPGTNMLTVGEGGTFGIIPLSDGTVYWYGTSVYPEGAKDTAEGRKADVRNQFSRWHAPIPALIEASDETVILREDIYDRKPISHWGTGLITMLGDAAHPCVPVLGMGACLALEDAVVLAKSIKETGYMEGALRIYEARRIPRTAEIVKRSHQVAQIMHANNMLALMYRTEFLTKYMQGEMSKQFETIMKVEL
jgi:2-polyprenyl-6-methoxyphenol hydroxylase-like FAD-dependent oxidoreductase